MDDDIESRYSEDQLDNLPLVLLMGRKRSGKLSIVQTVFHRMDAFESNYLESTTSPGLTRVKTLIIDVNILELPGQIDYFAPNVNNDFLFSKAKAVIYVIDTLDEFHAAVRDLSQVIYKMNEYNPEIRIEVLLHKIDTIEEDYRAEMTANIYNITTDYLFEGGMENLNNVKYYNTSIYDQSVYELLSKILSQFVPGSSIIERLINGFVEHSSIEKAFLCDIKTKLYFVTDSLPFDLKVYEVCADFIDLAVDLQLLVCGDEEEVIADTDLLFTSKSSKALDIFKKQKCVATLNEGLKLYLCLIINDVCLVTWVKGGAGNDPAALDSVLDYNTAILKTGLEQMFLNPDSPFRK